MLRDSASLQEMDCEICKQSILKSANQVTRHSIWFYKQTQNLSKRLLHRHVDLEVSSMMIHLIYWRISTCINISTTSISHIFRKSDIPITRHDLRAREGWYLGVGLFLNKYSRFELHACVLEFVLKRIDERIDFGGCVGNNVIRRISQRKLVMVFLLSDMSKSHKEYILRYHSFSNLKLLPSIAIV